MADKKDQELHNRFMYHEPGPGKAAKHAFVRDASYDLALVVSMHTPPSREQSLALTKIEEAMFWANAAIARNG